MSLEIIILAAGHGKRMKSNGNPKVLAKLAGRALIDHVVNTAKSLKPKQIHVVYGYSGERVQVHLAEENINWVHQPKRQGTGHAVQLALKHCQPKSHCLILFGDVPLISGTTLSKLIEATKSKPMGLVTAFYADPRGLGRVLRDTIGRVQGVREDKDANAEELKIKEAFSGILTAKAEDLNAWLGQIKNNNAQKEYYLTDAIALAAQAGKEIVTVAVPDVLEVQGVNTRQQLVILERYYQRQYAERLLSQGVTVIDPARFDCRGELTAEPDVFIDVNAIFEGTVTLGEGCHIGPNCIIKNSTLGKQVEVKANTVIEDATISDQVTLGPFARIRPGTRLAKGVQIGNFVEIKNASIAEKSKVNHLSYIGDSTIGKQVNVGAGTITCNYDGAAKHKTIIGDAAFIGSGTQLVAPVTIGKQATIGAGSVITRDTPAGGLTLSRVEQVTHAKWRRKVNKQDKEVPPCAE